MNNIYQLNILPQQEVIDSVASLQCKLIKRKGYYRSFLIDLKLTLLQHNFLSEHDHWQWANKRGRDYFNNPKLFAYAPLAHVCAFLSELFKHFDIDTIHNLVEIEVFEHALQRLNTFTVH